MCVLCVPKCMCLRVRGLFDGVADLLGRELKNLKSSIEKLIQLVNTRGIIDDL